MQQAFPRGSRSLPAAALLAAAALAAAACRGGADAATDGDGTPPAQAAGPSGGAPGGGAAPAASVEAAAAQEDGALRDALGLLEKKDYAAAAAGFAALAGKAGSLEDYRLSWLGRSLLAAGRPAEARAAFAALRGIKGSLPGREAAALVARCWTAEGKHEEAAAAWGAIAARGGAAGAPEAQALLMQGRELVLAGRPQEALAPLERVVRAFPHRKEAGEALAEYAALAPGFVVPDAWRTERAAAFEKKKLFGDAAAELAKVKEPAGGFERKKLRLRRAGLLVQARGGLDEALALLLPIMQGKDALAPKAHYLAARCRERRGETQAARALFASFLKKYPSHAQSGGALAALVRIDMRAGRWAHVVASYGPLAAKKGVLGERERKDVQWSVAFASLLAGRTKGALKRFESLRQSAGGGMELLRARYWLAVALAANGKKEEAAAAFEGIVADAPLHYYGLQSALRLGGLGREPALPSPPAAAVGVGAAAGEKGVADACGLLPGKAGRLRALGLAAEAHAETAQHAAPLVAAHGKQPRLLAALFDCVGGGDILYRRLKGGAEKKLGKLPGGENGGWWEIAYPRPMTGLVDGLAAAHGVPADLVLSVMRQESGFNPQVTSPAGAMGLMQLMPGTASRVAGLLGEEYDREAVFAPAVNVRYGTYYLSLLLAKFGGSALLAAGAYNAGPGAVEDWLGMKWTDRMDLFVELVPAGQTRNYMRRVYTSLVRYRFLRGETPDGLLGDLAATPAPPSDGKKLF